MGNRAVIEFANVPEVGIYLHWNGGRDSVQAFLEVAKGYGVRDDNYGVARLAQIIGNYLKGTYSIGIGPLSELDCNNGNNGVYVISNWEIVNRKNFNGGIEQEVYDHDELVSCVRESNNMFFASMSEEDK